MGFRVEHLTIAYGQAVALADVTLDFEGGALGLLGPNGAGKSSLLRALLGFVEPRAGSVSVLGHPPGTDPRHLRREIGFHPEDDALLPGMSAVAAVTLCGELSGLPKVDALQRAHELLYFVGLGEARYRQAETYSQGMRQRLKLAQALVHDPRMLILDEPTNGLDPRGRLEILQLVADLARNKQIDVILSSHLLPDVEAVCDQVAVLQNGTLRRAGRLDHLLDGTPRAFEVRLRGDLESFRHELERRGAHVEAAPRNALRVELPRPGGPRDLFELAAHTGCQVRGLRPARQTLTEVFADSVRAAEPTGEAETRADS